MEGLEVLSQIIGWLYTIAWSVSFYPQIILNFRRKSVTGLSLEYQAYNITGFTFYFIYCVSNFVVQHDESLGLTQSIEINDLVFATHAIAATLLIIYQCVRFKLKSHNLNKYHLALVCVFWLLFAYNLALVAGGILPFVNRTPTYQYTVAEYLGYVKVCISFVKYCPQAFMNWSRKSTVGWSVGNVLLDLTGGLLAFGQQGLEAYRKDDMGVFTSNIAKLLLSIESVLFDLLFIVQHYILYRGNNAEAERLQAAALTREEAERIEEAMQARAKQNTAALVPGALVRNLMEGDAYQAVTSDNGPAHRPGSLNGSGELEARINMSPGQPNGLDMGESDHTTKLLPNQHQRKYSS